MAYIQYLQDLLDRQSGLTDTTRGDITGATLGEVEEAQQQVGVRERYARARFREGVTAIFKAVGHFFIFNNQVVFWASVKDPATGQKVPFKFMGGLIETPHVGMTKDPQTGQLMQAVLPPQDPGAYQRLNIHIEPYSMEMVDQGMLQRRMQFAVTTVLAAAPVLQQFPFIKGRNLFNDMFEALNVKGGGDKYIDFAILGQSQQAAIAMQAMGVAQEQQGMAQQQQQSAQGAEAHQKAMAEPPKEPAPRNMARV
jgi:hypothetical protein